MQMQIREEQIVRGTIWVEMRLSVCKPNWGSYMMDGKLVSWIDRLDAKSEEKQTLELEQKFSCDEL